MSNESFENSRTERAFRPTRNLPQAQTSETKRLRRIGGVALALLLSATAWTVKTANEARAPVPTQKQTQMQLQPQTQTQTQAPTPTQTQTQTQPQLPTPTPTQTPATELPRVARSSPARPRSPRVTLPPLPVPKRGSPEIMRVHHDGDEDLPAAEVKSPLPAMAIAR
jgi:hypothetical protein